MTWDTVQALPESVYDLLTDDLERQARR